MLHKLRIDELPTIYIAYKLSLNIIKHTRHNIHYNVGKNDGDQIYICSKQNKGYRTPGSKIYRKNHELIKEVKGNVNLAEFYQEMKLENYKQEYSNIFQDNQE